MSGAGGPDSPTDGGGRVGPPARIARIKDRTALDDEAAAAYDRIVESRGSLLRPFEILLHAPAMAERVAELGHVVRFGSGLPDEDRELATLATGRAHACGFVWESHLDSARTAGVASDTIERLERGDAVGGRAGVVVAFANELCAASSVSDETFDVALGLFGAGGVVELAVTVGYYTMLSFAMRATGAC